MPLPEQGGLRNEKDITALTPGTLQKRFAATRERAGIPREDFPLRDLRA